MVAVRDHGFTDFGQGAEFVGVGTTDGTAVSFYRTEGQTTSGKDSFVGIVHIIVALVQTFPILIEGIRILHNEFSGTDQTETGTLFVSVLGLDLIQILGQLTIGTDFASGDISEDFFVSGS